MRNRQPPSYVCHRPGFTTFTLAGLVAALAGAAASAGPSGADRREMRQRAFDGLKAAVAYKYNTSIRIAAVEALEASGMEDAKPWIRLALADEHPGVRFAACLAVARLKDTTSLDTVRGLVDDGDANVEVAAMLACHALGHDARTAKMPTYLLDHDNVTVRRNAAMVFGFFDGNGAVKILARAMRDQDNGVREYALEALARHRNPEAEQELVFMTNTGVGSDEVFAINALSETRDTRYRDTYLYKLATGTHLETQLAAARALGILGRDEGRELAVRSLRSQKFRENDMDDPPSSQRAGPG